MGWTKDGLHWLLAAVAIAIVGVVGVVQSLEDARALETTAPSAVETPEPTPETAPAPIPAPTPPPTHVGIDMHSVGAATTVHPSEVRVEPSLASPVVSWLRPGIVLPVDGFEGDFVRVLTPCEVTGWLHAGSVELHPKADPYPRSLDQATIVLDPGHGGNEAGAIGPGGLMEKEVNLDITRRLVPRLGHARVFVTRDADLTAGLTYRTKLANTLGAHAFISIHNNAAPHRPVWHEPGTETYHQVHSTASKHLATALWQDVFDILRRHEIPWAANITTGPKARANRHGADYYAVLRGSSVPAVIVEIMFLSNAAEEELLRSERVQERIAKALSKSITAFVEGGAAAAAARYAHDTRSTWRNVGCVDPGW